MNQKTFAQITSDVVDTIAILSLAYLATTGAVESTVQVLAGTIAAVAGAKKYADYKRKRQ